MNVCAARCVCHCCSALFYICYCHWCDQLILHFRRLWIAEKYCWLIFKFSICRACCMYIIHEWWQFRPIAHATLSHSFFVSNSNQWIYIFGLLPEPASHRIFVACINYILLFVLPKPLGQNFNQWTWRMGFTSQCPKKLLCERDSITLFRSCNEKMKKKKRKRRLTSWSVWRVIWVYNLCFDIFFPRATHNKVSSANYN